MRKCFYCKKEIKGILGIDHIIPKSIAGLSGFNNTVSCCIECNRKKHNNLWIKLKDKFIKFRAPFGKNRLIQFFETDNGYHFAYITIFSHDKYKEVDSRKEDFSSYGKQLCDYEDINKLLTKIVEENIVDKN